MAAHINSSSSAPTTPVPPHVPVARPVDTSYREKFLKVCEDALAATRKVISEHKEKKLGLSDIMARITPAQEEILKLNSRETNLFNEVVKVVENRWKMESFLNREWQPSEAETKQKEMPTQLIRCEALPLVKKLIDEMDVIEMSRRISLDETYDKNFKELCDAPRVAILAIIEVYKEIEFKLAHLVTRTKLTQEVLRNLHELKEPNSADLIAHIDSIDSTRQEELRKLHASKKSHLADLVARIDSTEEELRNLNSRTQLVFEKAVSVINTSLLVIDRFEGLGLSKICNSIEAETGQTEVCEKLVKVHVLTFVKEFIANMDKLDAGLVDRRNVENEALESFPIEELKVLIAQNFALGREARAKAAS